LSCTAATHMARLRLYYVMDFQKIPGDPG